MQHQVQEQPTMMLRFTLITGTDTATKHSLLRACARKNREAVKKNIVASILLSGERQPPFSPLGSWRLTEGPGGALPGRQIVVEAGVWGGGSPGRWGGESGALRSRDRQTLR